MSVKNNYILLYYIMFSKDILKIKNENFDYIKEFISNQPTLLRKLKLIYFLQDFNIYNYFKTKLKIPSNYLDIVGSIIISDDGYTFQNLIENMDISLSDNFFIKPWNHCISKYDIPILEWWVSSGLLPYFENLNLKTEFQYRMHDFSKKKIHVNFLIDFLESKILESSDKSLSIDVQILDWYLKNNVKLYFPEFVLFWCLEYQKTNILNWWFNNCYNIYIIIHPYTKFDEKKYISYIQNSFIDKYNSKFIINQLFKYKKFKSFLFLLYNNIKIHIKLYDLLLFYSNDQQHVNLIEFLLSNKHLFPSSLEKKHFKYLLKNSNIPDIKTLFLQELENF